VIFKKRGTGVLGHHGFNMTKLNPLTIALAILALALRAASAPQPMNATNHLQGTWSCVSATIDGRTLPPETTAVLRLTLTADRYKTEKAGEVLFDSTYTLKTSTDPKQINMVGTEGELTGKEAQGIYAVEGDVLRICYRMPGLGRPRAFESTAGSKSHYVVWKRQSAGPKKQ
jgi:uncharacterized protein (TIGR03067 family)